MNKISIVIPILNEEATIGKLLNHLIENSSPQNISDIIVVDGGSTDHSDSIVKQFDQVSFLKSEKGRAKQMNIGAQKQQELFYIFYMPTPFLQNILTSLSLMKLKKVIMLDVLK